MQTIIHWTGILKRVFGVTLTILLVFASFKLAIFYMPFLIAFIISLLMEPLIRKIMKKLKFSRKLSSIIVFVMVFGIIITLLIWRNIYPYFRVYQFVG